MDKLKLNEGAQYLGRGVNIFEASYPVNEQQFKDPIIADVAEHIAEISQRGTATEETYGSNFVEFSHALARETGLSVGFWFFSASVEAKFTRSACQSTTTQFLRQATVVSTATLSIGEDPAALGKYLTPAFKNALENEKPRDLFNAYGTHLAVKANIGGRAEYICHALESESKTKQEFELSARAKFKILAVSAGANIETTTEDEEHARHVEGASNLVAYGGDARHRQSIEGGDKQSWVDWAESEEVGDWDLSA